MSSEIAVTIVTGLFLLAGGVVTFWGTRGKTQADAKAALDARIDARVKAELERVYKRLDEVEGTAGRQAAAFARILRAIARQWTGDPRGPDLDPSDIAEVENTIPPQWLRKASYPSGKD